MDKLLKKYNKDKMYREYNDILEKYTIRTNDINRYSCNNKDCECNASYIIGNNKLCWYHYFMAQIRE